MEPITVSATYVGGVLKPEGALPLAEGTSVFVTVSLEKPHQPTLSDAIRKINESKSLEELLVAAETARRLHEAGELADQEK